MECYSYKPLDHSLRIIASFDDVGICLSLMCSFIIYMFEGEEGPDPHNVNLSADIWEGMYIIELQNLDVLPLSDSDAHEPFIFIITFQDFCPSVE